MNEDESFKNEENSVKNAQTIASMLKRILVKLDLMDEKIGSLARQSRQKTFQDDRYSKSRKEFSRPGHIKDRTYRGKKEEVSSEGKFYHGRPFGKKNDAGKSSFKRSKKPFKK